MGKTNREAALEVPVKRHISDLFRKGKRTFLDDGSGDEGIPVWVESLVSLELKQAMKAASAARARVKALTAATSDDERRMAYVSEQEMDGMTFDRESLLNFLAAADTAKSRMSHEAELADEDEWKEEGYLEGLMDSWNNGLQDKWLIDNDDEEAAPVYDELARFAATVKERVDADRDQYVRDHTEDSTEELFDRVVDILIEADAENVWFEEYRKQLIYLGTRQINNHRQRYFSTREELDECDGRALKLILAAIDELNVEAVEGKD